MKIIGEKLNKYEMLSIKGGSDCMVCTCNFGGAGPWYTMETNASTARDLHIFDCNTGSGMETITCLWGPGDGNCPAGPQQD